VNLDMPLLHWAIKDVVAFGGEHSSLGAVTARALKPEGIGLAPDPMPHENIFVRSDQYSFVKQGIPAIYLMPAFTTTPGSPDPAATFGQFMSTHYHRPTDDLSLPIHDGAVAAFTRANYLVTLAIADQEQPPAWNPDSFFGRKFGPKR
jgi:Zn-dependent M28 family amino/carboxypeptidase